MTVSIVIISHDEVGSALVEAATKTFGDTLPLPTTVVDVRSDTDPTKLVPKLKKLAKQFGKDEGMLVLTDLYGSTPANIAKAMRDEDVEVEVVSGLNMPMMIRVMNYPTLGLKELAEKALSGGKEGVRTYEGE